MWTFGDYDHAGAVALLALVAFFLDISEAQKALVQGMRRIADLARMNILGALYGTVFGIAIVYFWKGACGAVRSVADLCGRHEHRHFLVVCAQNQGQWRRGSIGREVYAEASELVKLGVVFMASGLATVGAALFGSYVLYIAI